MPADPVAPFQGKGASPQSLAQRRRPRPRPLHVPVPRPGAAPAGQPIASSGPRPDSTMLRVYGPRPISTKRHQTPAPNQNHHHQHTLHGAGHRTEATDGAPWQPTARHAIPIQQSRRLPRHVVHMCAGNAHTCHGDEGVGATVDGWVEPQRGHVAHHLPWCHSYRLRRCFLRLPSWRRDDRKELPHCQVVHCQLNWRIVSSPRARHGQGKI